MTIPKDIKTKYAIPFRVRLDSDGTGEFTFDRAGGIMALRGTMAPNGTVLISTEDLVRLDYKAEANDRTRQILLHILGLTDAGYPLGKPKTSATLAGEVARTFTREAEKHIATEKEAARARVDAERQRDRAEHAEASLKTERRWHIEALGNLRKAYDELIEWRNGTRRVQFLQDGVRVETTSKLGGTATVRINEPLAHDGRVFNRKSMVDAANALKLEYATTARLDGKPDAKCKCCGDRGTATSIGKVAPAPKADPTAKALMERIETLEKVGEDLRRQLATAQGWVGQLGDENGKLKGELMDAKIKLSDINNALGRVQDLVSKLKSAAVSK